MSPRMIGTVWPTARSLAASDRHHRRVLAECRAVAGTVLADYRHVYEQGEDRYYDGPGRYAVVSERDRRVRWFTLKNGHWYAE